MVQEGQGGPCAHGGRSGWPCPGGGGPRPLCIKGPPWGLLRAWGRGTGALQGGMQASPSPWPVAARLQVRDLDEPPLHGPGEGEGPLEEVWAEPALPLQEALGPWCCGQVERQRGERQACPPGQTPPRLRAKLLQLLRVPTGRLRPSSGLQGGLPEHGRAGGRGQALGC